MSLNDEVYVMSFLYEALGKYIEYCERRHKDFNQEGFILITQKFIENLLPQQKAKGLIYDHSCVQKTAQEVQQALSAQSVLPVGVNSAPMTTLEKPLSIKAIEPVTIKEIKPLDKVPPVTTSVNDNNLRSSQTQSVQSSNTSATSQRLNSFSNILAKRHT